MISTGLQRTVRKIGLYALKIIGVLFIMWVGLSQSPAAYTALMVVTIAAIALMGFFALIQFAFGTYFGVRYGNPFLHNSPEKVVFRGGGSYVEERGEKKGRVTIIDSLHGRRKVDICPICKKKSGCTIGRNGVGGVSFHTIRQ